MKKILISIKPKWTKRILNGDKTIEVRKTAPKCELPCEVYIYCTKEKILGSLIKVGSEENSRLFGKNSVIGINKGFMKDGDIDLQGKVVARFTLNKVEQIIFGTTMSNELGYFCGYTDSYELLKKSCLTKEEMRKYVKVKDNGVCGYAWHIDNLVIFDKPKELKEFDKRGSYLNPSIKCPKKDKGKCNEGYSPFTGEWCGCEKARLTHAPQSWQFVEVDE